MTVLFDNYFDHWSVKYEHYPLKYESKFWLCDVAFDSVLSSMTLNGIYLRRGAEKKPVLTTHLKLRSDT